MAVSVLCMTPLSLPSSLISQVDLNKLATNNASTDEVMMLQRAAAVSQTQEHGDQVFFVVCG
jgi:hypothetical protein